MRSGASPESPGVPVVEWKTFVVMVISAPRSASHRPMYVSLRPPP